MEKGEHKRIIEAALTEMTGEAIRIKCVTSASPSVKSQMESASPHKETDEESGEKARSETREKPAQEVSLDPIELIKARFKAKVVQKIDLKDEEKL